MAPRRELMLVDLWQPQHNYRDRANVGASDQERSMRITLRRLEPHARRLLVCRNFPVVCTTALPTPPLDFAYIDARHDYKGVLEDLAAFWPATARRHHGRSRLSHRQRDPGGRQAATLLTEPSRKIGA